MASNNKPQNEGGSGTQPQRNNGPTSSGVGALFSNIISRASPSKRSEPFPQLEIERDEGAARGEREWEDIPEPPVRTTATPKSIMHTPSTPSRENRVSFEGDRKTNSEGGRRDRSATGSARSGRGVGEFVSSKLHESNRGQGSASTVTPNRRPDRPRLSPSPTRRQPVPAKTHPLTAPQNSPPQEDDTFLNPGNAALGTGDFDASRPLTPDEVWGDAERDALRTGTGDGDAARANPDARGVPAVTGFEIETVAPFEVDPHSPLAEPDPNLVPPRTIIGRLQGGSGSGSGHASNHGTPPRFPANTDRQAAGDRDFPIGTTGLLKPDANVKAENTARRGTVPRNIARPQPRKETEILPPRARRPGAGGDGHGPTRNPAHGGRRRPGPGGDRERRERRRQRALDAEPYRPLDPYAYPAGQKKSPIPPLLAAVRWAVDWAENNLGLVEEEGGGEDGEGAHVRPGGPSRTGESIPMTGRRPAWMTRPPRDSRPVGGHPPTSVPPNETEAERMARERGEREALTTHVDAHRLERVIQEREARLALEEAERRHHRRLTNEEIREELEHGLPVVPRTSPTRRSRSRSRSPARGNPSRLPRPAAKPHPSGVESAPSSQMPTRRPGQAESSGSKSGGPTPEKTPAVPEKGKAGGTLSPPKASPGYHPASDPGSPVKQTSPFNLGGALRGISKAEIAPFIIEAEKQVELTLRQWVRFALVQAYRHALLRMPSLYFNRVGRVFTEADFNVREIDLLLNRAVRDGPNSVPARVLDRRSPWRGYGGLAGGDEHDPLLSDGRDSNSPSPNQRPLPLGGMGVEDTSDLEAGSAFGGGSTLAGQAPDQLDLELKKSLVKLERFRIEWEGFIDGMVKEWKTLNVVSALLLSALLTVFQIQEATYVPVTRTAALLSLVSAFMSLLFGGVYIIRFSTMRTMRKAARWVEDAHKQKQKILWNIWILLSLPVTWLVYSLIFFCIAILGFVWTSGTGTRVNPPSSDDNAAIILGPRIGITVLFSIGFIYFCLVLNTFRVWSGVTVSSNNDTLPNLHSPPMRVSGDGEDEQSPPGMRKEINEPSAFVPPGWQEGGSGLDGMQALASQNITRETWDERGEDIARGLEGRTAHSVGSAPSILGLEFTPAVESRPAVFRHSPNVLLPTLTSTPPRLTASDMVAPDTLITQPTPTTHAPTSTFVTDTSNSAPLTAVDPLMNPGGPLGLQDPIPVNSPPFTRHIQALDLDDGLPDRHTPPSTLTSEYATPMAETVSEFGTLDRGPVRMGRGR